MTRLLAGIVPAALIAIYALAALRPTPWWAMAFSSLLMLGLSVSLIAASAGGRWRVAAGSFVIAAGIYLVAGNPAVNRELPTNQFSLWLTTKLVERNGSQRGQSPGDGGVIRMDIDSDGSLDQWVTDYRTWLVWSPPGNWPLSPIFTADEGWTLAQTAPGKLLEFDRISHHFWTLVAGISGAATGAFVSRRQRRLSAGERPQVIASQ